MPPVGFEPTIPVSEFEPTILVSVRPQTHDPSKRIRTHDPSKRAAADPRLRPHGHWDRLTMISLSVNIINFYQE
jgi:hypothetical protein